MNTKEFKQWCTDTYDKFLNDKDVKEVLTNNTEILLVDTKNKRLHSHTIIKDLEPSFLQCCVSLCHIKRI